MSMLRQSLVVVGSLVVITGLAYPLAITGTSKILFPHQAEGSLIRKDGKVLGSSLIAQHTEEPRYFWGRLSATDYPTDADNSSGSNLAASNPTLKSNAETRIKALRAADPGNTRPVPADLVTSSGSGLDPDITPAAADYQVQRVARVRRKYGLAGRSSDALLTRDVGMARRPVGNVGSVVQERLFG